MKAAEQGHAGAQRVLGYAYWSGQGVDRKYAKAVKWLTKAADQADFVAQHLLAGMYLRGEGVKKDPLAAVKWFKAAAEQGQTMAQFSLGMMYATGEGVPKNLSEAEKWFKKAAAQEGSEKAEESFAMMFPSDKIKETHSDHIDAVTGIQFVLVQGGAFEMGDFTGNSMPDERPVHEVQISDFYIGKYEVTQRQWERIMGFNFSHFKGVDRPADRVSWRHIQLFISRLNEMTGMKYRLPTEAEWEYAARSGGKKTRWAGAPDEFAVGDYAWFGFNSGLYTHRVGEKKPNELGLYDMNGNVAEWVWDWYAEDYYANSPRINPQGPDSGTFRVVRGGGYSTRVSATSVRSFFELSSPPNWVGFRLAFSAGSKIKTTE